MAGFEGVDDVPGDWTNDGLFNCDNCPHEFPSAISHIVSYNSWCPYCCIPCQKLCDDDSCKICFDKSFESHHRSKYWNSENILKPRQVIKGSESKYFFIG